MLEKGRILVVEDDVDINQLLYRSLRKQGYEVTSAYSGTEAVLVLQMHTFDLVLLDLMLPGMEGERIIEEIRAKKQMPILVISAKVSLEDKVHALALGADDYIVKPFEINEVIARVEAQLRRYQCFSGQQTEMNVVTYRELQLVQETRMVYYEEQEVGLTSHEYDILQLLMLHTGRVFTREAIYRQVWQENYVVEDNTVNVHISNIRAKLQKVAPGQEYIKTVWGIGFKMS